MVVTQECFYAHWTSTRKSLSEMKEGLQPWQNCVTKASPNYIFYISSFCANEQIRKILLIKLRSFFFLLLLAVTREMSRQICLQLIHYDISTCLEMWNDLSLQISQLSRNYLQLRGLAPSLGHEAKDALVDKVLVLILESLASREEGPVEKHAKEEEMEDEEDYWTADEFSNHDLCPLDMRSYSNVSLPLVDGDDDQECDSVSSRGRNSVREDDFQAGEQLGKAPFRIGTGLEPKPKAEEPSHYSKANFVCSGNSPREELHTFPNMKMKHSSNSPKKQGLDDQTKEELPSELSKNACVENIRPPEAFGGSCPRKPPRCVVSRSTTSSTLPPIQSESQASMPTRNSSRHGGHYQPNRLRNGAMSGLPRGEMKGNQNGLIEVTCKTGLFLHMHCIIF